MKWAECEAKVKEVIRKDIDNDIADTLIQETSLVEDIAWFIHTEIEDLEPDETQPFIRREA